MPAAAAMPTAAPGSSQYHGFAQHQLHYVLRLRDDRHANADLTRSPRHFKRKQTVQPQAGQHQGKHAEEARKLRGHALAQKLPVDGFGLG
jgi:hypothetical protein